MKREIAGCLVLACSLWGCGSDPAAAEIASPSSTSDLSAHDQMLLALQEVAARTSEQNSYLGDQVLRGLRARLAAVPAEATAVQRARLHFKIGHAELRQGALDTAIEELQASAALLRDVAASAAPPFAGEVDYLLGVAYLRLGETRNCVARHTAQSCIFPIDGEAVHVDHEPRSLAARWLLNIAYMTVGEYPEGVPDNHRIAEHRYRSQVDFPRFRNIAPDLGVNTFNLCGGSLIDDFDGDGLLDLLNSTWSPTGPLRLFASRGDGSFEERTGQAGIEGIDGGLNLIHADYDNDGDLDVLVLRGAWLMGPPGQIPNSLLRNDGNGSFQDVTFDAGLGDVHYPTQTAAFADYDNDGDLDLYVGNEALRHVPFPSQLFQNQGDGTFVDVASAAGVENLRFTKGVSFGDYNGDRFVDLYVSNLDSPNRLYHNQGDGTFSDVAEELGVTLPHESFPCWFWDFNNDGALDLYVSSYFQSSKLARLAPVVASYLDLPHDAEPCALYRGDGKGGFVEVSEECGLGRLAMPMGANFGDLDNDGYLDFYLGTGYPSFDGLMPNLMFWNRSGLRFEDVTTAGGFGHLQKGHGVSFADLDNDGDQDIFEQMGGAFPADRFGNVLYENPGFSNHWIKLRLTGVQSNRSALGARIHLTVTESGQERSIYKDVNSGGSFGGNPLLQHIGLGQAQQIDRLRIYWPASNQTQEFRQVDVDQCLAIVEGQERYATLDPPVFRFGG
jgi:hypothetical protein